MRPIARLLPLLLLVSCRRGAPPAEGRQELRIAQLSACTTLDPHRHDSYYTNVALGHFYDRLVNFGPNLELVPELAIRWENPSETLWRLHLRDGVVFHDGRPFGAADVVASIRRAGGPDSQLTHYLREVQEARAVDRLTVELVTGDAAPVLLNGLAFVMMVPRDAGAAPITRPVGTGPYRFVSGSAGHSVRGERFERYWGPRPAFEKIRIFPLPDATEREEAIPSGRADFIAQFPSDGWEWAKRHPEIVLQSRPGLAIDFISLRVSPGSPFADLRVRQAVSLTLDREAIVKNALNGLALPAWQLVSPAVFGYAPDLPHPVRDPVRARALLAAAGFKKGLSSHLVVSQRGEGVGREVARQLAEVGIRLDVEVLSHGDFLETSLHREIDIAVDAYATSTGDAANFLEAELHSPVRGLGIFNAAGYRNPRVDALIEKAGTILDPKVRHDVLVEAMRISSDDLPLIPLTLRPDLYAFRRGLRWEPRHARLTAADVFPAP